MTERVRSFAKAWRRIPQMYRMQGAVTKNPGIVFGDRHIYTSRRQNSITPVEQLEMDLMRSEFWKIVKGVGNNADGL